MSRQEYCCQVDQFCKAPPNDLRDEPGPYARGTCFACGLAVCVNCSLLTTYHNYGRKRLCHSCYIDYANSDVAVMKQLYQLAGYKPEFYPQMVTA